MCHTVLDTGDREGNAKGGSSSRATPLEEKREVMQITP